MMDIQPGDVVTLKSGGVYTVTHGVWFGAELIPVARITITDGEVEMPVNVSAVVRVMRGDVEMLSQLELWRYPI